MRPIGCLSAVLLLSSNEQRHDDVAWKTILGKNTFWPEEIFHKGKVTMIEKQ